jgi:hypothetical protein
MKPSKSYLALFITSLVFGFIFLLGIYGCGDKDCDCHCDSTCPDEPNDEPNPPDETPVTVTVNFENLTPGNSVEGLGAANSHLNIHTSGGNSRVIQEGLSTWGTYGAPSSNNQMTNGCLGSPGSGTPISGRGKGFADLNLKHDYIFTFGQNESVKDFSITMLDFGDLNPERKTYHEVNLRAYDSNNNIVDIDTLSYTSSSESTPRTSEYGDLMLAGDACTAKTTTINEEPGVWTFKVVGQSITRVELNIVSGIDPNIAFDTIKFTLN